jgi:hypothetical protein
MEAHATGIARWAQMLRAVQRINAVFNGHPSRKSLYDLNMLNPLNLMPLRWLSILFGVNRECWDDVIVPMYASTFLSTKLDMVPAIILPIISDIIPLTTPARLRSWADNSTLVFDRMLAGGAGGGRVHVHLDTPVVSVEQGAAEMGVHQYPASVQYSAAPDLLWTVNGKHHGFDRVVFASNVQCSFWIRHGLGSKMLCNGSHTCCWVETSIRVIK